jgi:hypothetical protein
MTLVHAALDGPWGRVSSANLTPDPSGIPYYDEERFVQTLRTGYVGARQLNQIMPWSTFRHRSDEDLKSIYAYLKTLKPVKHRVDNSLPPTYCKVCRETRGDLNESDATWKSQAKAQNFCLMPANHRLRWKPRPSVFEERSFPYV